MEGSLDREYEDVWSLWQGGAGKAVEVFEAPPGMPVVENEVFVVGVAAVEVPAIGVAAVGVAAIEVPAIGVAAVGVAAIEVPAVEVPAIEVAAVGVATERLRNTLQ